MAMDIGAVTPFPYALREREYINDLHRGAVRRAADVQLPSASAAWRSTCRPGWGDKVLQLASTTSSRSSTSATG